MEIFASIAALIFIAVEVGHYVTVYNLQSKISEAESKYYETYRSEYREELEDLELELEREELDWDYYNWD